MQEAWSRPRTEADFAPTLIMRRYNLASCTGRPPLPFQFIELDSAVRLLFLFVPQVVIVHPTITMAMKQLQGHNEESLKPLLLFKITTSIRQYHTYPLFIQLVIHSTHPC